MVTIYTVTYKEELLLPFMVDHYRTRFPHCSIIVFDNLSPDNTPKIAKKLDCQVIPFDTGGQIFETKYLALKNNCWKSALTDWVLVCDIDELFDITQSQLQKEESLGSTIITPETWDMINLEDNLNIAAMKYGVRGLEPGKYCLFNKKYLRDINYGPGCHSATPEGQVILSQKTYKLYHYNAINIDRTIERFKERSARLSEENRTHHWGDYLFMTPQEIREEYTTERQKAIKIR